MNCNYQSGGQFNLNCNFLCPWKKLLEGKIFVQNEWFFWVLFCQSENHKTAIFITPRIFVCVQFYALNVYPAQIKSKRKKKIIKYVLSVLRGFFDCCCCKASRQSSEFVVRINNNNTFAEEDLLFVFFVRHLFFHLGWHFSVFMSAYQNDDQFDESLIQAFKKPFFRPTLR